MAPSERTPLHAPTQPAPAAERPRRLLLIALTAAAVLAAIIAWFVLHPSTPQHLAPPPAQVVVVTPAPPAPLTLDDVHCGTTKQETGYIQIPNKHDDVYFYWYHSSQRDPAKDPLIVWFTGGPGCSSMMALLTENGPCTVNANLTTKPNPYSWNRVSNVLWVDQPSNVGFSQGAAGDADATEDDVQANFYSFLLQFLDKHPELRSNELYLVGESYGGHYVPAVAHKIWQENKALAASNATNSTSTRHLNLQGIAIGNGLVNPAVQIPHALDMLENKYYNVSAYLAKEARDLQPHCLDVFNGIMNASIINATEIMEQFAGCAPALIGPYLADRRNPYDIRKGCVVNKTDIAPCYDMSAVTAYLNSPVVKQYLNISAEHDKTWMQCDPRVGEAFMGSGDFLASFSGDIADLLDDGHIRVLVYAGDADTVCNWYSDLAWMTALEWTHQREFDAAIEQDFALDTVVVGRIKAYSDLFTFLRVFDAGHMVPMDQPVVALAMINAFVANKPLLSTPPYQGA